MRARAGEIVLVPVPQKGETPPAQAAWHAGSRPNDEHCAAKKCSSIGSGTGRARGLMSVKGRSAEPKFNCSV